MPAKVTRLMGVGFVRPDAQEDNVTSWKALYGKQRAPSQNDIDHP
jgi:hypothetical protein